MGKFDETLKILRDMEQSMDKKFVYPYEWGDYICEMDFIRRLIREFEKRNQ